MYNKYINSQTNRDIFENLPSKCTQEAHQEARLEAHQEAQQAARVHQPRRRGGCSPACLQVATDLENSLNLGVKF
jgi:hypothetical protein